MPWSSPNWRRKIVHQLAFSISRPSPNAAILKNLRRGEAAVRRYAQTIMVARPIQIRRRSRPIIVAADYGYIDIPVTINAVGSGDAARGRRNLRILHPRRRGRSRRRIGIVEFPELGIRRICGVPVIESIVHHIDNGIA